MKVDGRPSPMPSPRPVLNVDSADDAEKVCMIVVYVYEYTQQSVSKFEENAESRAVILKQRILEPLQECGCHRSEPSCSHCCARVTIGSSATRQTELQLSSQLVVIDAKASWIHLADFLKWKRWLAAGILMHCGKFGTKKVRRPAERIIP